MRKLCCSIFEHPHTFLFFFFNDTATTEIYTLSLHDALPISEDVLGAVAQADLELAGEDDDELATWGWMPVGVLAERPLAERDLRRRQALRPLRRPAEVDRLDV